MNLRSCRAVRVALALALLAASSASAGVEAAADERLELSLRKGKVLRQRQPLVGVTKPVRVELVFEGEQLSAAWKTVDVRRWGITRFSEGTPELNFSDSFRYERAAYLLDRELGLEMVPVAVIRRISGESGALVAWVEGAVLEVRMSSKPSTAVLVEMARQKDIMHVFDALILNTDRRMPNWLVREADGALYLIDHSRAFRESKKLPKEFVERPVRIPRELYTRMQGLEEPALKRLLKGLISPVQIRALLARRDKIVEKIETDLVEIGAGVVYE